MEPVVTVGLDGSAESLAAARWAADEAHRRGFTLRLLHAWPLLSPATPAAGEPSPEMDQNYWAKRIVHDAQRDIHERHPDVPIVEDLVAADAATALLGAAAESWMLVLGSRGLTPAESFFLGDASLDVVVRAVRPVVLVRAGMSEEPATATHAGGVTVGLSLHGPCGSLLEFAFDAAAVRGVRLHAVHGRSLPVAAYAPWGVDPDASREIREDALKGLSEVLSPWQEKFPGVEVVTSVRLESPARALVQAAAGSDLLVIGRREHRPALAPRLGNVAHAAAHHAACPVTVVPHD
ncbi:universal stress protein [Streptomyces gilvosporeus]|uniref:Stress-inducible protein n=1 Tax=Streptomyces gilvosporeus TaxID=553510 RepID=A0A1V0TKE0_9ACTN|nr:universal stress protein [Streptomyces gilvosporeus]ARF53405.1 stress-inducible protein [Streptomyces gilvosporeus]